MIPHLVLVFLSDHLHLDETRYGDSQTCVGGSELSLEMKYSLRTFRVVWYAQFRTGLWISSIRGGHANGTWASLDVSCPLYIRLPVPVSFPLSRADSVVWWLYIANRRLRVVFNPIGVNQEKSSTATCVLNVDKRAWYVYLVVWVYYFSLDCCNLMLLWVL